MRKTCKNLMRRPSEHNRLMRDWRDTPQEEPQHTPSYGPEPRPKAKALADFKPSFRTDLQRDSHQIFRHSDLTFFLGPPGSGKTFLAIQEAVNQLALGKRERIVIVRPMVTAGEDMGYLPGDIAEKTLPYLMPIYDSIAKLVGRKGPDREAVDAALDLCPLGLMRGRTFDNAICILDESQNATYSQLKLFVTRIGENAKMIITGDPYQSDLPKRDQCLMRFVEQVETVPGVGVVHFGAEDIVRHPIIGALLEVMD